MCPGLLGSTTTAGAPFIPVRWAHSHQNAWIAQTGAIRHYGSDVDPMVAPTLAAAALLVVAGAPKVLRPLDTWRALRSVGLPVPVVAVRLGGLAEVAIGVVAILQGGRIVDALVAASYLGFTAFVIVALSKGGVLASCGCVGRPDTPPTVAHVVVTALLAASAGVAAGGGPSGVLTWTPGSTTTHVTVIGLAILLTWLAWLALAELPRLRAIVRSATA
jgi:hypothetical protein